MLFSKQVLASLPVSWCHWPGDEWSWLWRGDMISRPSVMPLKPAPAHCWAWRSAVCVYMCTFVTYGRGMQDLLSFNHMFFPRWSHYPSPCWTRSLVKMLFSHCKRSFRFKVRLNNRQPVTPRVLSSMWFTELNGVIRLFCCTSNCDGPISNTMCWLMGKYSVGTGVKRKKEKKIVTISHILIWAWQNMLSSSVKSPARFQKSCW